MREKTGECKTRKNALFGAFISVVIFASFSMRSPIGCVGPLMETLLFEVGMNAREGGLLTSLPLILFALGAIVSQPLSGRFGLAKMIASSFFLVFVGTVIRALGKIIMLFGGTIILGLGTGILNVLIPSSINEYYPDKRGPVMGIYSAFLTVASASTAAFVLPLENSLGSWNKAFLIPSVFPLVALLLWCVFFRKRDKKVELKREEEKDGVFTARNFLIAIYCGFQSLLFFAVITWFPTIISSKGLFSENAGILVTVMLLASFLPSLFIPIFTTKDNITKLSFLLPLLFIPGIVLSYLTSESALVVTGTVIFGLSSGATFSMGLMLSSLYGKSGEESAHIMAFGQAVGYILASVGPMGFGHLYDITLSWTGTIIALSLISGVMSIISLLIKQSERKH